MTSDRFSSSQPFRGIAAKNAAPLRRLAIFLLPALALLVLAAVAGLLWLPPANSARAQAGQTVAADWPLIPDGIQPGDSFRLLFVTSTTRDASSANIADYNAHVQSAANNHNSLQSFKGEFRTLISTATVDARDNTATTGTGVSIHWLGGQKVADDYADLYDKTWNSVSGKTEAGGSYTGLVWTGGNKAGQKSGQRYAGADEVRLGDLSDTTLPLSSPSAAAATEAYPLYALSPVLTLAQPQPANNEPQFASDTAQRSVKEDAAEGASVGAAITATDADADTLTYTVTGSDAFAIGENTGQITVAGALNYESQQSYTLTVSVSDGKSADGAADDQVDDSITVTVSIGNVDEVGVVSLSSDTPQAGDQLSATLLDPDTGVSGETWTWERSADQTAWETIAGATGSAYTPSDTDVGSYLRATVAYSDGHGSGKTAQGATANAVTSAPTQGTEPASEEPTITAGPSIDSSPVSGDTYGVDELILVSYSFSEAVSVTDAPKSRLLVGERKRWAHYIYPEDDGATLVFVYLVKAEDRDANGVSVPRNALRLSGGTIEDSDGNAASLKHAALTDQSSHKVDGSRTAPANSPPVFAASHITRSVAEDAAIGANVGAAVTATDPDGDNLTYTLLVSDAFAIDEDTGQITVQRALDFETKSGYGGTVSISDGRNAAVSVPIDISIVNVDEPGRVILGLGRNGPRSGQPLAAQILDPDGEASGVSWSWARSADQTNWETIAGATGATYTPSNDDEGQYLQATAAYTDPQGPGKTAQSATPFPVAAPGGDEQNPPDNTPPTYSISSFWRVSPVSENYTYSRMVSGSNPPTFPALKAGNAVLQVELQFSEAIKTDPTLTINRQIGSGTEGTLTFSSEASKANTDGYCWSLSGNKLHCLYKPQVGENGLFKVRVSAFQDSAGNAGSAGSYNTTGITVDTANLPAAPVLTLKNPASSPSEVNPPTFSATLSEGGGAIQLHAGSCPDWAAETGPSWYGGFDYAHWDPVKMEGPREGIVVGTSTPYTVDLHVRPSVVNSRHATLTDNGKAVTYYARHIDDTNGRVGPCSGPLTYVVTSVPRVVSAGPVSLPQYPNHYYGRDESIVMAVRFDRPVDVDTSYAKPTLKLGGITVKPSGAVDPVADYYWHEGNTVYFRWKVLGGYATPGAERFPPGGAVSIPANPIVLNGGTIQHAETGVDADLSFGGWSESDRFSHNYQAVDGSWSNVGATVKSVAMKSSGPYYYGDVIVINVTFDVASGHTLKVRGSPYINVKVGSQTRKFRFSYPESNLSSKVLSFRYDVEKWHSEYDPDGISMNTDNIVMFHSGANEHIWVEPGRKTVDRRHPGMADQGASHAVDGLHGGLRDGKKFKPSPAAPVPVNLRATAGDGVVRLSWDPYDDPRGIINGWFVWWEGAPKWKWFDHHRTSLVVKGLTNGQEYKFRVRAEYDGSGGVVSGEVEATPMSGLAFPNRAPAWDAIRDTSGEVTLTEYRRGHRDTQRGVVLARLAFIDPEDEPLTYEITNQGATKWARSAFSVWTTNYGDVTSNYFTRESLYYHDGPFDLCVKATDPHGASASRCLPMANPVSHNAVWVGHAKDNIGQVAKPQSATGDVTFAFLAGMKAIMTPVKSRIGTTHTSGADVLGISIDASTGVMKYDGTTITNTGWFEYDLYSRFWPYNQPNEVELQVKITGPGLPSAGVPTPVRLKIYEDDDLYPPPPAPQEVSTTPRIGLAFPEAPLKQIEVGLGHACALDTRGRVACWGDDSSGQVSDWGRQRYQSQRFASISAGSFLTCGVLTNGSVFCWGYPEEENGSHAESRNEDWRTWTARTTQTGYRGWVNTPPAWVKFKPESLSVGNYHACAIQTTGELSCWGKAGDDRLVIPTVATENNNEVIKKDGSGSKITDWIMVEAGFANACGIRQGGSVVCFGRTTYGRSDGPSGSGPFVDVTLGVYNGCALAASGSVECWGSEGIAVLDPLKTPPTGVKFADIEMGTEQTYFYACGLQTGGRISCWGLQTPKQLTPLAGTWSNISVGGGSACALNRDGYLGCWGESDEGLFSPPAGAFKQTDGGHIFSCAIKTDGGLVCWGVDSGQTVSETPSGTFKQVAVGASHACAIRSDDTVACWGGRCYDRSQRLQRIPSAIAPSGTYKAISAGPDLTCAIIKASDTTDGSLHCWGATTHNRQNEPSGSFTHVAVGATHVCAIKSDRTVACWGQAVFFDREGDGTADDIHGKGHHTSTIPPSGSHEYIDISAGEGHTCALRTDKKAVCWGYHADSRQAVPGSGGTADGFGVDNYIDIATGGLPNCAIRESDGSLSCWNNEKSQYLPDASVRAMRGFQSLGAGRFHMCGINSASSLVCWGAGYVIPFPARFAPP